MGKCQQRLSDGEICGLETEADNLYCPFHKHNVLNENSINVIEDYIKKNNRESLDFSKKTFKRINFNSELFEKNVEVIFNFSIFKNCSFKNIDFLKNVSFIYCEFYDSIFEGVIFNGSKVTFERAKFEYTKIDSKLIPFVYCRFISPKKSNDKKIISFIRASFNTTTSPFKNCYLESSEVSFIDTYINSDRFYVQVYNGNIAVLSDDYLTVNSNEIHFESLKFYGIFEYMNNLEFKNFSPQVHFININFSLMKSASFFDANLKKAYFTYSILDNVNFINSIWPRKNRKNIIYDEFKRLPWVTDDELLRLYLQLKKKFDQIGDYITASDWYFREMEARRRVYPSLRSNILKKIYKSLISFTTWYRLVSDYGENHKKALYWLVSIWFVPSIIYFYNGITLNGNVIHYDGFFSTSFSLQNLIDFINTLFFSAGAMAFQVGRGLDVTSSVSFYTYIIQLLLTVIIVPLFLLALRRKFRR